jgi:hypothetical protein
VNRARGFFVVWWRIYTSDWVDQPPTQLHRAYYTTLHWHRMGRGRDFVN